MSGSAQRAQTSHTFSYATSEGPPPSALDENLDEDGWDDAPPVSDELITLRELGPLVRSEGPLQPHRAVRIVQHLAQTLSDASAGDPFTDEREQVYWLGAALFFALTARSPFRAGSRRPSVFSPYRVPAMLDNIVRVCLARHEARFATTLELYVVLGAVPLDDDENDAPPSFEVPSVDGERPTLPPGRPSSDAASE
jgi:hypothetical protein